MPSNQVMDKWKEGKLRSGNKKTGKVVRSQKQAVAIKLSEQRKERGSKRGQKRGRYKETARRR
jgi:hypothetical protein